MPTQIQIRKDTAANWTATNPILAQGEIGFETNNNRFKIGDGVTPWNTLGDYYTRGAGGGGAGVTDGDKGDITVSASGATWTLDKPVNLGDAAAAPALAANPFSSHLLYGNFSPRRSIPVAEGLTVTEFWTPITLNGQVGKTIASDFRFVDVQGASTDSYVHGSDVRMFSNSSYPSGPNSEMAAYYGSVDIGGPWTNSYGGYFSALMGGSGASGAGTITGVYGSANGPYNGALGSAYGGDFQVSAGFTSGATLTVGAAVRAKLRLNTGSTITDFRGVSISGWLQPSGGGVVTNMVGLYIDNSIDAFGTTKFAVKSDSVSDSLFAGPVRGPINPYDATGWNGSSKFATEDAVRDQIETLLPGVGVGGSGTINQVAYFTAATTLASMPLQFTAASKKLHAYHTAITDVFALEFTPSAAAGSGDFRVGNDSTVENYIQVDGTNARIKVATRDVQIGDTEAYGNATKVRVLDTANAIYFSGSSSSLIFVAQDVYNWQYNRTNTAAGTTGARTINQPVGSVNFAAGATTLVVTNNSVDANSLIFLTPQTNDATAKSFSVTRAAGSFTITANAAATAETRVAFMVTN